MYIYNTYKFFDDYPVKTKYYSFSVLIRKIKRRKIFDLRLYLML